MLECFSTTRNKHGVRAHGSRPLARLRRRRPRNLARSRRGPLPPSRESRRRRRRRNSPTTPACPPRRQRTDSRVGSSFAHNETISASFSFYRVSDIWSRTVERVFSEDKPRSKRARVRALNHSQNSIRNSILSSDADASAQHSPAESTAACPPKYRRALFVRHYCQRSRVFPVYTRFGSTIEEKKVSWKKPPRPRA